MSYVFRDSFGNLFLQRCPSCETENYSAAVSEGICAWCGYAAQELDATEDNFLEVEEVENE